VTTLGTTATKATKATVAAIHRLLRPRSVAIIGASGDATKTSGRPLAYLHKHGFGGSIYPVNPRLERIGALRCFPDVGALPEVPDVGIVMLGIERAHLAVRELAARGCGAAIVLASGYAEAGEDGRQRQVQLLDAAAGMRLLGPNTIGLVNLTEGIVLSASGALEMDPLPAGSIAVVSQSGGILGSLLSRAAARGIGMSKLVATSNEADLEVADFIDALAEDDATRVIALYIETVRHPHKFRAAALRAAQAGKPVVAFKVGRSEAGARATASHTGALAGTDRMYDAFFRQLGIVRAQTFGELLDISATLATGRVLHGRRVAVLTSTGGAGALLSDSLGLAGFHTPPPEGETLSALQALRTDDPMALQANPIDVTLAGLKPEFLRRVIRTLMASPQYDALGIIVGSSSLAQPELMAGAIEDGLASSDKPVIAYVSPHAPAVATLLTQRGVPAFSATESCAAALAGLLRAARPAAPEPVPADAAPGVPLGDLPGGALDEAQAKQLFAHFGVPGVREIVVSTPQEAEQAALELGGRVVLKILGAQYLHKTELGGVAVGLAPGQVAPRLQAMADGVQARLGRRPGRFLVQEHLGTGTEVILGLRRDALGTAVLLGMGGVAAELFDDTTLRLLPPGSWLGHDEALGMARELKAWPLLDGYRGREPADVQALAQAVVAFSRMASQLGEALLEAEINPLFVLPRGGGVRAADGVAILSQPAGPAARGPGVCTPSLQGVSCT
jgi:acyl-CoA synthetase (NDP forming)